MNNSASLVNVIAGNCGVEVCDWGEMQLKRPNLSWVWPALKPRSWGAPGVLQGKGGKDSLNEVSNIADLIVEGTQFAPRLSKDVTLYAFSPEICRYVMFPIRVASDLVITVLFCFATCRIS